MLPEGNMKLVETKLESHRSQGALRPAGRRFRNPIFGRGGLGLGTVASVRHSSSRSSIISAAAAVVAAAAER